jgi:NhaC family Na+:H+ antiporter
VTGARKTGTLIFSVVASGIGLNVIAGDQYMADVLPARMFRREFARRLLAPQVLSTAVENSGTVTSVSVPWNSCGAYISGVLGVATVKYLPYAFFCILSPIIVVIFGYMGFKVDRIEPQPAGDAVTPRSIRTEKEGV